MTKIKRLICIGAFLFSTSSCKDSDPYSEGMHWDYSITCDCGFVYKSLSGRRGTILVLNSDGTPLRCGKKRY